MYDGWTDFELEAGFASEYVETHLGVFTVKLRSHYVSEW